MRFIAILREPIARSFSQFRHARAPLNGRSPYGRGAASSQKTCWVAGSSSSEAANGTAAAFDSELACDLTRVRSCFWFQLDNWFRLDDDTTIPANYDAIPAAFQRARASVGVAYSRCLDTGDPRHPMSPLLDSMLLRSLYSPQVELWQNQFARKQLLLGVTPQQRHRYSLVGLSAVDNG